MGRVETDWITLNAVDHDIAFTDHSLALAVLALLANAVGLDACAIGGFRPELLDLFILHDCASSRS